jgi:cell division septum initiation protein DivIVA
MSTFDPPQGSMWTLLHDFDHLTAFGAQCVNCGSPKHADHDYVFRLQRMDEVDGFWDLCQNCIEEAAFLLGFTTPKASKAQVREIKALEKEIERLKEAAAGARSALAEVTRENVRLQDEIEDHEKLCAEMTA